MSRSSDYYPPGVSGNEPEITGDWPCPVCRGFGRDFFGEEPFWTVFKWDGTCRSFESKEEADSYAREGDEVVEDSSPTGEACCVACRGTGRAPEEGDEE